VEAGTIEEVLRPLMSGKEAAVFLVRSEGELRVAKVYKDAHHRSFRQRSQYSEGRTVRNSRQRRAMAKGSRYGKALLEQAWQNAEVDALYRLHHAGVRVPTPYEFSDDVLVMELITGIDGEPAPRLFDIVPTRTEALSIHKHLVRQVVRMLCAGMVHGDLSEYNILMAAEGPVIIDLPQATDAAHNRNSERILLRDVRHLGQYLGKFAPELRSTKFGLEMWHLYKEGTLHPDSELTGKFSRKGPRVDTNSVIEEIQAAAAEAAKTPVSGYRAKKERQLAEAQAAEEARAAQAAKRRSKGESKGEGKGAGASEGGGGKQRRRRRRRRPPKG
jgi:RIO kinase 1